MSKSKPNTSGMNVMNSVILLLVVILFCTIAALIYEFLPAVSQIPLILILSVLVLLITRLLVALFRFFRSINTISQNAELLAQNELNINDVSYEDALGLEILAIAFNDMKTNLQSFIDLTKGNIITISDAIESVSKSMNNSCKGNEQITASMVNVSEKAQDQAKLMGDTMSKIDEVKNRIENITNSIEEVEKSVEKTVHATTAGVQNLDDYNHQINVISDNLNSTSEYINKLSSDITQIDQIGKFIIKISEQLKLLGLNASVEAAKAGDSGKGFAVVAHEMNLLSAATKESIVKINTILKNISHSSEYVSKSINSCVKSYDASKDVFSSVRESFDIINNNASVLEVDMKKVYNDVSLINSSTHEINQKSLLLYNVSGEISSKTQEVAAVTEESLGELQEVNSYTSSLQNMLTGIEKLVKKFHTAVTPVEADSKSQLHITLISPLDNDFWYLVRQGVLYAIKELSGKNVLIDYVVIKEDVSSQIKDSIKNAIEKGVSGIIVPGFNPDIVELIEAAYQKNIPVMIYHFNLQKESKRVAYCGPEFNAIGANAALLMAKALRGKGDIALFFGNDTIVEKNGREVTLSEIKRYKGVKVVADYQCANNIELSYNTAKDLLRQNQNINGMIVSGVGLQGVARAIEELGYVGKIPVVTFNFGYEISEYIKKGIVYATMIHDTFSQGHDPIIHLYNMLVTGQKPESEKIWTRCGIINKNNVNDFI